VIFHACAETTHTAQSLPYLEDKVGVNDVVTHPKFRGDQFGVLLPGVAENPTCPILSALVYTPGGYRPTCD